MRFDKFNVAIIVFLLLTITMLGSCSRFHTVNTEQIDIIDISRLESQQDVSSLEKISRGVTVTEPLLFKVPEGFELPVHVALDTPLANLDSECSKLVFTQELFLYINKDYMLVSPDKIRWVAFSDIDGMKELFGGGQGELSIGIGASKESGAKLELKLVVHPRG